MKSQLSTNLGLPLIDLADAPPRLGAHRRAIVDQVEGYYLGQPDTLLLEDGRTILVAYPNGHGGPDTILKRSTDAGLSWSDRLPVPASFVGAHNAPTIHRLIDSDGKRRIFLNTSFPAMRSSLSEDDGKTWTDLELMWRKNKWRRGFKGHAPMKSVIPIDCGGYLGMYHDHFEDDAGQQVVIPFTTVTTDGGLTWSDPHGRAHVSARRPAMRALSAAQSCRRQDCGTAAGKLGGSPIADDVQRRRRAELV